MRPFLWLLLITVAAARSNPGEFSVVTIPKPSGTFAVGRVAYDWIDRARPEVLSKVPNTPREIAVDVWYPAIAPTSSGVTAPYFPDAEKIEKSPFAPIARRNWAKAWPTIVSDNVHSQTYQNVSAAPGDTVFPLIIFSHGYGVEPFAYTHQIQELVSHGYVVASIHHTYEAGITVLADGRVVPFSDENARGEDAPTLGELRKWEDERADVWAADIRFTLDQITRLNTATKQKAPFTGRVDTGRVGALGHSFGGVAVGRACELDRRIIACLNQDGLLVDGPILRYVGGHMPAQAFMFLHELSGPGTDRSNKNGAIQAARIEKELQECSGTTYQVRAPI